MVEGPTTTVLERENAATAAFHLEYETPKQKKVKQHTDRKKEKRLTKDELRYIRQMEYALKPATNEETWFRHTNWKDKRTVVRAALVSLHTPANTLDRFDQCGGDCIVQYCKTESRYRVQANYCKCRHCEPCQRAKANKISLNLRNRLEGEANKDYRFFTFTLKHNSAPLREQITRLYASFKKLRKYKIWSKSQRGGATMLEVKWSPVDHHGNDTDTPWHPHLHVICEGTWISQKELQAAWYAITTDSFRVDVRFVNSSKDAAHYVSKYISKGTNDGVWANADAAAEWIEASKGVRTCGTFGSWRGYKLLQNPTDEAEWVTVGTLSHIVTHAQAGEPWAVAILRDLKDKVQYDPHRKRKPKKLESA